MRAKEFIIKEAPPAAQQQAQPNKWDTGRQPLKPGESNKFGTQSQVYDPYNAAHKGARDMTGVADNRSEAQRDADWYDSTNDPTSKNYYMKQGKLKGRQDAYMSTTGTGGARVTGAAQAGGYTDNLGQSSTRGGGGYGVGEKTATTQAAMGPANNAIMRQSDHKILKTQADRDAYTHNSRAGMGVNSQLKFKQQNAAAIDAAAQKRFADPNSRPSNVSVRDQLLAKKAADPNFQPPKLP